jgi:hypothetical protein
VTAVLQLVGPAIIRMLKPVPQPLMNARAHTQTARERERDRKKCTSNLELHRGVPRHPNN